jgi:transposase InsO family protein
VSKYSRQFDHIMKSAGINPIRLPPRSPNLNAYSERFVRSLKDDCLNRLIILGERQLRRAVREYLDHYHRERPHQGHDIGNQLLFPDD